MSDTSYESLPHSEIRQIALLGHLLDEQKFFAQAKDIIRPEWFLQLYPRRLFAAKVKFWNEKKRPPTDSELAQDWSTEAARTKGSLNALLVEARGRAKEYGLDTLTPELTTWLHARLYHEGVHRSTELYNAGKFDEAYREMEVRIREIRKVRFDPDVEFDLLNYEMLFGQRDLDMSSALTFGNELMDRALLPEGKGGGLVLGDTTVMLAPTNIGKTATMITIAAANVHHGRSVLFLSHEGRDDDIAQKMWSCITRRTPGQLTEWSFSPDTEQKAWMSRSAAAISNHLTYVALNKPGMPVEEVGRLIERKNEERRNATGKGYDLVVDDYPAKLGSENLRFGQFQKRNLDEYVYNYFVQLALTHKFHCLVAIQGNREASRINKGQKGHESRLLTHEDVHESFGPMQTATNIITVNRSPEDMRRNRVVFYLSKSRSSGTDRAVVCCSDFASARTHGNEGDGLKAITFRGSRMECDSNVLQELLNSKSGQEVMIGLPL